MSAAVPRIAAVVLAAGSSQRMGEPKQLLPLAGRPLVQHAIDAAADADLAEVVVVLGHEAEAIRAAIALPPHGRVVENPRYAEGQGTSLACGLAALGDDVDAAAVLLGDEPDVTSALVTAVVAAFVAADAPAVRPVWRDVDGASRPGHPVVLARRLWPELAVDAGDGGARALFAAHPEWVRALPLAGAPPSDIDDPADYRRAASGG